MIRKTFRKTFRMAVHPGQTYMRGIMPVHANDSPRSITLREVFPLESDI